MSSGWKSSSLSSTPRDQHGLIHSIIQDGELFTMGWWVENNTAGILVALSILWSLWCPNAGWRFFPLVFRLSGPCKFSKNRCVGWLQGGSWEYGFRMKTLKLPEDNKLSLIGVRSAHGFYINSNSSLLQFTFLPDCIWELGSVSYS